MKRHLFCSLSLTLLAGSSALAAGPVDPCDQTGDDGRPFGNFLKSVQYKQEIGGAPVLDVESGSFLGANYRSATNQVVTSVSLNGPGGTLELMNIFPTFHTAGEVFDTPAELDAAFPAGNYTLDIEGVGSGTLPLGNMSEMPVPEILNLAALAAMDVSRNFTLNFAPFTGARASDSITIFISGPDGNGWFQAPDLCRNILLPNTATSVVIPANTFTFQAGASYLGSITFSRGIIDTNSIPGTWLSASVSASTQFEFTIGPSTPPGAPEWTTIAQNPDGTITFNLASGSNPVIAIEGSDQPDSGWVQIATAVPTNGSYQFVIDPRVVPARFFRARVQ